MERDVAAVCLRSFGPLLANVGQLLDAIAGPGAADGVAGALARVPASVTNFFGFEVSAAGAGADVLLQLRPSTEPLALGTLAGGDDGVNRRLEELLSGAAMSDDASPLACKSVWVEYDLGVGYARRPGSGLPVPSLFCAPRHLAPPQNTYVHRALGASQRDAAVAMEIEHGLWPGAGAFQRGAMLSRASRPFRLCLVTTEPERTLAELVRWVDDRVAWEAIAAPATEHASLSPHQSCVLDIELRNGVVQPVIGVELSAAEAEELDVVVDALGSYGLADPGWLLALAEWPGEDIALTTEAAQQLGVRPPVEVLHRRVEYGVIRRVNHLKTTHRQDRTPSVKAYLGVRGGYRVS
ncbi:MAG: hypothetical protein AAGF73_03115 [Actinomycetota bacterium]